MSSAFHDRLKMTAAVSVVASLTLAASPFFVPQTAIGALVFANWLLFMVVSYFAFVPLPRLGSFSTAQRTRLIVWMFVFFAFTAASWTALS